MLRVPSEIAADQFESLKIQELTFVAYRSDVYPSKNEVFFEENAVIESSVKNNLLFVKLKNKKVNYY